MDLDKVYLYPQSFCTLGILFFWTFGLFGQEAKEGTDSIPAVIDQQYREDQFYIGLTFNFLSEMPKGMSQTGFSGGAHLGFIRDFPLNRPRNFGLGLGLGWSINSYRSNLLISKDEKGGTLFQVLDGASYDFKFSRFSTQLIEVPLEIRWRTSSADDYRFWRIYAGLRLGYMYRFQSNFRQAGKHIKLTDVKELNRMRYGLTFTFGYNTFNFTVYYSLNPFFNGESIDQEPVDLETIKLGLMFYIL